MKRTPFKPKRKPAKSLAIRAHFERLAAMPCLVADGECDGRTELHHVTSNGFQRIVRSDMRVVPLCGIGHHRLGRNSVHQLSHARFAEVHGVDLLAESERLWENGDV